MIKFRVEKFSSETKISGTERVEPVPKVVLERPSRVQIAEENKKLPPFEFSVNVPDLTEPYYKGRSLWTPLHEEAISKSPLKILVGDAGTAASQAAVKLATTLASHYHSQLFVIQNESLLQEALALPADLLVAGCGDKNEIQTLLQQSNCPVLLCPNFEKNFPFKKILVPVDGTPFSYAAVARALAFCHDFNSQLILFHVSSSLEKDKQEKSEISSILHLMKWGSVSHELITASGAITSHIADYAEKESIDMIVMGTHPLGEKLRESKSVTEELAALVSCPIFVVHPQT